MPSLKAKNTVMLVFSLLFYAFGEPIYILLLVGMAAADWLIARYIEKQKQNGKKGKFGVFLMCLVNLGLLGIFKYGTFFLENLKILTGFPSVIPNILLPIGISFYTFQLISYVVDVYRGEVPAQKNFFTLLLYVSMFHQCIAGPIVRYKDICAELENRRVTHTDLAGGVWRFTVGLAKKAILANACELVSRTLLTAENNSNALEVLASKSVSALWLGMVAYALYIYLDFSAYSDMAIGMGQMIGIHYNENFNYPYIAASVTEFWRRWHISLSTFFRDYVYIPLGGNRKGRVRTGFNLFIVWALTGFWHGASWNFVLWGIFFFVFAVLERLFLKKLLEKVPAVSHIYLLIVVLFGWILFRFTDLKQIWTVLRGMFGANGNPFWSFETGAAIVPYIFVLIFAVIASTPLLTALGKKMKHLSFTNGFFFVVFSIGKILLPIILLILSTAALVGDSYQPFLYFRF